MEYIDLHMHSLFSDGTDSPDELVRRAKEAGLSMIALTDHNTLDGIPDFREACARYHMAGIDGVELSTGWERITQQTQFPQRIRQAWDRLL